MKTFASLLGTAALLAGCFTSAHAASLGTLTCTADSKQLQVNLSHFHFGTTLNASGVSVAAPVLNIHAALSQFGPFNEFVGKRLSSCELRATLSDGTVADIQFTGVVPNVVTAVARTPRVATDAPAMFTDVTLTYKNLKVVSAGGSDDGGTDGGWYTPTTGTGPSDPNQQ